MDKIPPEVGELIAHYANLKPNRQTKARCTVKGGDEKLYIMYQAHPLDGLSRTSRLFRNVCLPIVFEEITMKGNKRQLLVRLAGISLIRPVILGYIKSVYPC
jgi:hypothetical protein